MADTALYVGVWTGGSINWLNRYEYSSLRDVIVNDGLGAEADTLSCTLRFPTSFVDDGNELPLAGQLVRLVIEDEKVFEGTIATTGNLWLVGGASISMSITCVSYVTLMNRHKVVVKDRRQESAGSRIRWVLSEFAEDFADDLSNIENATTVPQQSYDYQAVSAVLTEAASSTGYLWYVTYDKVVHFFADINQPAPIPALDVDTDLIPGDITIDTDASNIINVVILKDFASKSSVPYTHNASADGKSAFYPLPLGPFDLESTEVRVQPASGGAWIDRVVVEDPVDGSNESIAGAEGLAFLCVFNWGVRFPERDLPYAGDTVQVKYKYEIPERITVVFDQDSINEMARREGGDGHHEEVYSIPDFRVRSDEAVVAFGELILSRRAWPIVSGQFLIKTTSIGAWKPGQTLTIISEKRDVFDVRTWVRSGYVTKDPVRVYTTRVDRSFRATNIGMQEHDVVYFTTQPWEMM